MFVERPADIKRLVDYLLGAWSHASAIDPGRIGMFGFSRGGYTGLVVVGVPTTGAAVVVVVGAMVVDGVGAEGAAATISIACTVGFSTMCFLSVWIFRKGTWKTARV